MYKFLLCIFFLFSASICVFSQEGEMSSQPASFNKDYYLNDPIEALDVVCIPNPTYDVAVFEYELKRAGEVSVKIYNDLGHKIDEPQNEYLEAGKYEVQWSPLSMNLKGGVYYARVGVGTEYRLLKVRYIH
jgi:hypothetical protein